MTTRVVFCRNRNFDEKTEEMITTVDLYTKNNPNIPSNTSDEVELLPDDFLSAMDKHGNDYLQYGEKGGECYTENTTNDVRLPLFQLVRNTPKHTVKNYIKNSINTKCNILDKMEIYLDLFRLSMHLRDKDEGKGERDLSYWMLVELHKSFPKSIRELIKMLPIKYGCWLDYLKLIELFEQEYNNESEGEKVQIKITVKDMMNFMCNKIMEDSESDKPSLLAKWWPREGGKYSDLSRRLSIMLVTHKEFSKNNSLSEHYHKLKNFQSDKNNNKDLEKCKKNMYQVCRKFISNLNKRIGTIETLECSGNWSSIKPSSIPSKHLKIRTKAFQNLKLNSKPYENSQRSNDPDRIQCAENFKEYFEKVRKGEIKINARGLFIYELVKNYYNGAHRDETWELQFKKIVDETPALESFTCLADTSGSMSGDPIIVAISLAALIAKKSKRYPNRYISFNTVPSWKKIPENASLFDIVQQMKYDNDWGGSTNFAAAMDLMIGVCKQYKVSKEEVKQMKMVVVSDMQFDCARGNGGFYGNSSNWSDSARRIKDGWIKAGYPIGYHPEIIYWNVRHTGNFVAQADTPGVQMMAGYNQTQLKVLLKAGEVSNKEPVTPLVTMRTALDSEYFDDVVITLQCVGENIFENLDLELFTNNNEDNELSDNDIQLSDSNNSLFDEDKEIELRLNKLKEIRK